MSRFRHGQIVPLTHLEPVFGHIPLNISNIVKIVDFFFAPGKLNVAVIKRFFAFIMEVIWRLL